MTDKAAFPSDAADKVLVRMPDGMRERLKEGAKVNNRTMNAEIVARLVQSFDQAAQPDADWRTRVEVRTTEVRIETLRGHLSTVRMHADILAQRLDRMRQADADETDYDIVNKNYIYASKQVIELEQQLEVLMEDLRRLEAQNSIETMVEFRKLEGVVDKNLQAEYRKLHELEVAMGLPEELRQIKLHPSIPKKVTVRPP